MKHMRKIIGVLAVLLICTAFVGAGAAFTISDTVKVDPSGILSPGDKVSAKVTIKIAPKSLEMDDYVTLSTDLIGASWHTKIYEGEVYLREVTKDELLALELTYPGTVKLVISLDGTVASSSKGKDITVLKVESTAAEIGGLKEYSSPSQYVNNPDNLKSDLEKLNTRVKTIESRISVYAGYGFDTTAVTQKVTQAKTYINTAINAGTTDASKAFSNINSAVSLLNNVEMILAKTGLDASKKNMDQISEITSTLYERGWKSEAQLLETRNTKMEITYNSLYTAYKANSIPDATKLDELVVESYDTLAEANEYLEDSKYPVFVKLLPFIGGGIVIAGAVVGIVFLIRRRRANSWDELG